MEPSDQQPSNGAADPVAAAQQLEDQEWNTANGVFRDTNNVPRPDVTPAKKPDEADPNKPADPPAATPPANETPEQKAEREKQEAEAAANAPDPRVTEQATALSSARATQRELAADREAMIKDINEQMFSDIPARLEDADGDPINGIEDVMRLINPNTGQPFTEEQAAAWLLAASQQLAQRRETASKDAEAIAEVNLDMKDWAFNIARKYGAYLKDHPQEQADIWADYQATLVTDPKTDIITKAPVNMERFYDRALSNKVTQDDAAAKAAADKAEADRRHQAELEKARQRGDRTDIYTTGKSDTTSDEDKEWGEATKDFLESLK